MRLRERKILAFTRMIEMMSEEVDEKENSNEE